MKIYKYKIEIVENQVLQIPHGFTVLSFQMQDDQPVIWVSVDPEKPLVNAHFTIVGTGHDIPESAFSYYLGTIQQKHTLYGTNLVWHLILSHIEPLI